MVARCWLLILAAVAGLAGSCQRGALQVDTVSILVAEQDIPACTRIDEPEKLFKAVEVARGDVPADAVTQFEQLQGKTLVSPLTQGQPISKAAVLVLPPGMRAVVIKVFVDSSVTGFFVPGCYIDLVQVVEKSGKREAVVLLERVKVLAVLAHTGPGGTLTVLVKESDVAKLTSAMRTGMLTAFLSRPNEQAAEPGAASPFDGRPAPDK